MAALQQDRAPQGKSGGSQGQRWLFPSVFPNVFPNVFPCLLPLPLAPQLLRQGEGLRQNGGQIAVTAGGVGAAGQRAARPSPAQVEAQGGTAGAPQGQGQATGPQPLGIAAQAGHHQHQPPRLGHWIEQGQQFIAAADPDAHRGGPLRRQGPGPQAVPQGLKVGPEPGSATPEGGQTQPFGKPGGIRASRACRSFGRQSKGAAQA
jgi:hypothetical protein